MSHCCFKALRHLVVSTSRPPPPFVDDCDAYHRNSPLPLFRTTAQLIAGKSVMRGRAFISGTGYYEVYSNGGRSILASISMESHLSSFFSCTNVHCSFSVVRVGDAYLDPSWTSYDQYYTRRMTSRPSSPIQLPVLESSPSVFSLATDDAAVTATEFELFRM